MIVGQFAPGPRHELHAHVHCDEQCERQLLVQRDEREIDALRADINRVRALTHAERAY